MISKIVDTEFIEKIVIRAGAALKSNEYKRLHDSEQLSLTLHLMMNFGYQSGGKRVTPKKIEGLLKAVEFAKLCVGNGWVDSSLKVICPTEAKNAFGSAFSDDELHAFDYME
jgi:hypothetical protein